MYKYVLVMWCCFINKNGDVAFQRTAHKPLIRSPFSVLTPHKYTEHHKIL